MLRSRLDRPKANRVFTNREEPIAHFERARAELPVDQHRVLGFHGVGGQGKTYLRNELIKRLSAEQPRSHRFGVIDFDTQAHCDAAQGLLQLRCSLHVSGAIRTQVFDVAILRYWEQVYPTQDPQTALGTVLGDNAELFANIADTVTGGLAGLALQVARKLLHNLKEQRAMDACQALDQLDHLDNTELLGMLPAYLGLDLQRHRADQPDQCAPILFFDTYEALWSDRPDKTGITAIETDAWVRELITAAPGCLFVILGRERLNWNRALPDHGWAELLDDQHLLGGLSEDDAEQFLRAIPIDDAAIRCVIIDGASVEDDPSPTPGSTGALPFYLDLAVDTWLDLEATGIQPTPDQFGHSHPMVIARFLRHRDPAEIEALKVLSVPNGFDRDLFTALMVHFHTGYQPSRFEELCGLTIIEPSTDGLWRPHALMREYLLDQLEPAFRRELDAVLFDWYDARCQPASPRDIEPAHETALKDAVAHRDTEDAVAALAWFWLRQQVFWDAARLTLLEPFYRWALALAEDRLGPDHPETAIGLNNLALLLQATNRLSDAEPLMRRVVSIFEVSYGEEHPKVATALNNLAQLLQATNRLSEAEPLMRRALAIDEASYGAEHPEVARDLNNLAALLQATNRLSEAEPLMRRALAIDEASYGAEHPEVARDLNNLAQLLKATNRLSEAEPLMRRALAIDEASYGAEHPDVARDLNNLAQLLQDTNRLSEAEPLMRRALAIDEASYGSEHPNVAIRLNNLAQLLKATNRLSEAEPLSRRHVLIFLAFTRDTGHRHPHLVAGFRNYRALLSAGEWTETEMQERLLSLGPEAGLEESTWAALRGELGDTD
jgi:tetratricopeptide (TPR) repeat protein